MESIRELLVKYIAGSADAAECAYVEEWLEGDPVHMEEYIVLEKAWRDMRLAGDPALLDADKAFGRLKSRLVDWPEGDRRAETTILKLRLWRRVYRVAAVFGGALLVGAGILYWMKGRQDAIVSGLRQAERIVVPKGQKKHIFLPDSTELWLNAGSVLEIAPGYGVQSRQVVLEGEGFFKVKHDEKLVFTVETPYYTIKDIGTAFNVHTYAGDSRFEAAVVEGEISVEGKFSKNNTASRIVLSHNQVLKIRKDALALPADSLHTAKDTAIVSLTQSAAVARYAGWKEDELVFDDDNFRDIANALERKFNVSIRMDDESLGSFHFTGSFKGLPDVGSVLDILKETTPFVYDIKNDTVILKRK